MSIIQVEWISVEVPDDLQNKGLEVKTHFIVYSGTGPTRSKIGSFTLEPMPGCCGIVVSTQSFLEPHCRGGRTGKLFHELKAKTAKTLGYTTMFMTTQLRNIPEVVGASHAKWKFLHYFRNSRTNNDIGIAVKDL